MSNFRNRMEQFFRGRYGVDQFGRFLMYAGFVLVIVSFFVHSFALTLVTTGVLIYGLWRMLSRNYAARRTENAKYLQIKQRIVDFFRGGFRAMRDREHAYFRCPQCRQKVRVPRGKGHISIHCPRCHTDFIRRT